jgi:hypothetical protein
MRLRREREPSPDTIRVLAAVDAALAGDRVDAEHADLRDLAVALRDERPQARPEFELALDLRVHEGFPREDRPGIHKATPAQRRELHTPRRLRTTPLALGTAASIFIVATALITTGVLGGGSSTDQPGSRDPARSEPLLASPASRDQAGRESAPSQSAAPAPSTASPPSSPPLAGVAPGKRRREVERSAELVLSTQRGRIEDVSDRVVQVVDRHGGFVLSSSVSSGARSNAGASFDLRIPTARLDAALADLSELSHVRSRTQGSRDVTAEFTSPRRRLADALAERRGLLRQLARADTPNETAAIRARLRAVNRRANRAQAELRRLRERVTYAAVSVAVRPGAVAGSSDDGWSLGDAARDALSVLGAIAGAAIVALAVAVPAAIVALLAWFAYRAVLRRRREQALDMPTAAQHAPGD